MQLYAAASLGNCRRTDGWMIRECENRKAGDGGDRISCNLCLHPDEDTLC